MSQLFMIQLKQVGGVLGAENDWYTLTPPSTFTTLWMKWADLLKNVIFLLFFSRKIGFDIPSILSDDISFLQTMKLNFNP